MITSNRYSIFDLDSIDNMLRKKVQPFQKNSFYLPWRIMPKQKGDPYIYAIASTLPLVGLPGSEFSRKKSAHKHINVLCQHCSYPLDSPLKK